MSDVQDPFFDASGSSLGVPVMRVRAWAAGAGGLRVAVEPLESGARIAMHDFVFNDGTAYFLGHWLNSAVPHSGDRADDDSSILAQEIVAAASACKVPRAVSD